MQTITAGPTDISLSCRLVAVLVCVFLVASCNNAGREGMPSDELAVGEEPGAGPGSRCPDAAVTNRIELSRALNSAAAGSVICIGNGVWENLVVTVGQSGNSEAPIVVRAETPGDVFIEGESLIEVRGDHVQIEGLYFRNGQPADSGGVIKLRGDYNQLTQTTIDGYDSVSGKKWVSLYGQHADISYNLFENKTAGGVLLTVWRSSDEPQYHKIHHNYFRNYADGGGVNGWETIRIGTSTHSQSDSYTLIENNRFENCDGEIEIISVKSGRNILRGNVFINSKGLLTLRHGKANTVENNIFIQSGKADGGGVRFYDEDHVIRNNYIAGVRTSTDARGAIVVHSGRNSSDESPALNAQWTPRNVLIENNTIYLSEQSVVYGGKYAYPAERIRFSGNIVYTDFTAPIVRADAALVEASYSNEKYWGADLGFPGAEGVVIEEFPLTLNDQGLYLHSTLGAQGLYMLKESDVGPNAY